MPNLPANTLQERIFSFTEYFLKSRGKPGHVDALAALEALSNPVDSATQRLGSEVRLCVTGISSRHPGKYIRVILLGSTNTIHNAFLDRGAARRIGRGA
jgi:hypothetical protein